VEARWNRSRRQVDSSTEDAEFDNVGTGSREREIRQRGSSAWITGRDVGTMQVPPDPQFGEAFEMRVRIGASAGHCIWESLKIEKGGVSVPCPCRRGGEVEADEVIFAHFGMRSMMPAMAVGRFESRMMPQFAESRRAASRAA